MREKERPSLYKSDATPERKSARTQAKAVRLHRKGLRRGRRSEKDSRLLSEIKPCGYTGEGRGRSRRGKAATTERGPPNGRPVAARGLREAMLSRARAGGARINRFLVVRTAWAQRKYSFSIITTHSAIPNPQRAPQNNSHAAVRSRCFICCA